MKLLMILVSSILLYNISTFDNFESLRYKDGDSAEEVLTFDGFEGGYLFFTSEDKRAVVLEVTDKKILRKADLINGDFVGKKLKIKYKKLKDRKKDSSSEGTIEEVKLIS